MQSYHIRISAGSRKRLEESKRKTGKSFSRLIDETLGIDEYTLSDEQINEWVQEGAFTSPPKVKPAKTYSPLPKPCPAVIDAQILMCWQHEAGRRFRRNQASAAIEGISLARKELITAVRQKIKLGYYPTKAHAPVQLDSKRRTWGEVYPKWFKNHQKNRSEFEIYFDNRLLALVKQELLSRIEDGLYKLNSLYPVRGYQKEWVVINGVTLLPPQEGLDVPHLFKVRPVAKVFKHDSTLIFTDTR